MKAGEFYVDIKLNKEKFDKGITESKKSLRMFALEAAASVYALDRFVERSTNSATAITNLSRAAGVAASDLKRAGFAASFLNAGISAEEASGQIAEFYKNIYDLRTFGQGNAGLFNKLGAAGAGVGYMDKNKSIDEVVEETKQALKSLDRQYAISAMEAGGLNAAMYDYLTATEEQLKQISNTPFLTDEQIERSKKADEVINRFKNDLGLLSDVIVSKAAPAIEQLGKSFTDMDEGGALTALSTILKSIASSILVIGSIGSNVKNAVALTSAGVIAGVNGGDPEVLDALKEESKNIKFGDTWKKTGGLLDSMWGRDWSKPMDGSPAKPSTSTFQPYDINTPEGANRAIIDLFGEGGVKDGYIQQLGEGIYDERGNLTGFKPPEAMQGSSVTKTNNVTVNNTNHIHGSDAAATAGMIGDETQKQIKHAVADQNNGAF